MAIDFVSAALDAVAAYFASVSGIAAARRGWPEQRQELDLSAGPLVTVSASAPPDMNDCAPAIIPELSGAAVDGVLTETYRVGWPLIRATLDIWVAYRSRRDDAVQLVLAALEPSLPRPGLWLTSTGYFNRPLTVRVVNGPRYVDESESAGVGEWRATFDLEIDTDRVKTQTHPVTTRVDLSLSTETQGETVVLLLEDVTS